MIIIQVTNGDVQPYKTFGTKYSRMEQVKFVEDSLEVIWSA